ncbi:F510_1955 family glycosylhydrolase [Rummeliibacillus stabekisii]|uniref:F510_1955 family glycosylhydrolase n=1 Tax=Rummeliibacillus stabekisii TaxID=241244 RepID=UPI00371E87F2
MKRYKILVTLLTVITILSACNSKANEEFSYEDVKNNKIEHIHGSGFMNAGSEFVIATHLGLYKYGKDGWKEANSEKHDYMGFQTVKDGFIASGHPEKGSEYKNPFGVIKSKNNGASFERLAFYGEIDFHYLTTGYYSNTIYVYNETQTEGLNTGLNYSVDNGVTWKKVAMNGFTGYSISNLAAHPINKSLIAVGSKDGVFMSNNYGEDFTLLYNTKMVTYVTLNENGGYYSNFADDMVHLKSFLYENNKEKEVQLPNNGQINPIISIAVNPKNQKEIVIITYTNDIYITKDKGENWNRLSSNGKLIK